MEEAPPYNLHMGKKTTVPWVGWGVLGLFVGLWWGLGCLPRYQAQKVQPPTRFESPRVRVAIAYGKAFDVYVQDSFWVYQNGELLGRFPAGQYRIQVLSASPAPLQYWVWWGSYGDPDSAQHVVDSLQRAGYPAQRIQWGQRWFFPAGTLDVREQVVLVGPYTDRQLVPRDSVFRRKAILEDPQESQEDLQLELLGPQGQTLFHGSPPLRFLPHPRRVPDFTLLNFVPGIRFRDARTPHRTYRGILEFRNDGKGHLLVVNELPVEVYLLGVVPKEMGPQFPPEALKAQAIVARTYTYWQWGKGRAYFQPYDLVGDYSVQAYGGQDARTPETDEAVRSTRGLVVFYDGRLAETLYHSCCGGYTEDMEVVFGKSRPYLKGVYCGEGPLPFTPRDSIERWILDPPEAFCSPEVSKMALSRKNFRWHVELDPQSIRTRILRFYGKDVGKIVYLRTLKRSPSGRILSLKIQGILDQVILKSPYSIRRVLRDPPLRSTMFIIDYERGPGGLPYRVILEGGGNGHGVGLCQLGAAGMARQGDSARQILAHYYPGTGLRKLY